MAKTFGKIISTSKIPHESSEFPGITMVDAKKINETANRMGTSDYEKSLIKNDLYKVALQEQKARTKAEEKIKVQNELKSKALDTDNPVEKNTLTTIDKSADVAKMINHYLLNTGAGDFSDIEDSKLIEAFCTDNPAAAKQIENYINYDGETSYAFSKKMGFDVPTTRSKFALMTSENPNVMFNDSDSTVLNAIKGKEDGREWNDDVLGHFGTTSYQDAGEGFWNKAKQFGENALASTYNLGSDITNIFANPVDTVNGLAKTAVGATMNAIGSDDYIKDMSDGKLKDWLSSANQVADGAGEYLLERYGGVDNIANSLYQDPAGVISDIASLVSGVGGAIKGGTKGLSKVAAKQGLKTTSNYLDDVSRVAGKVSKVANEIDPATQIMKTPGRIIEGTKKLAEVPGKVVDGVKGAADTLDNAKSNIVEKVAEKVTKTDSPQNKLFQAQEPTINKLSKNRDMKSLQAKSNLANELVVQDIKKYGGELPTDTKSRVTATQRAMNNKRNEITKKINTADNVADISDVTKALDDYIREEEKLGLTTSSSGIKELKHLSKELKKTHSKGIDLPTMEAIKQRLNKEINTWGESNVSETSKNGMKILTKEIGKIEDSMLSNVPGEFQNLKNEMGALLETFDDIVKSDIKEQRSAIKGASLSNYTKLQGLGNAIKGIVKGDISGMLEGAVQSIGGDVMAKVKERNFLIENGFKGLAEEMTKAGKIK